MEEKDALWEVKRVGTDNHWPFLVWSSSCYGADLIFGMGHMYKHAKIIHNYTTLLLHMTVVRRSANPQGRGGAAWLEKGINNLEGTT